MTTFWTLFQKEPDSIRVDARRAHLREVAISSVAESPASLWMVDMPALAAQYPSVAADLKTAGLTAQEHDAYRLALITAQYVRPGLNESKSGPTGVAVEILTKAVAADSALRQNIEFFSDAPRGAQDVKQHRDVVNTVVILALLHGCDPNHQFINTPERNTHNHIEERPEYERGA